MRLEYYRLQKISEGSISLKEGTVQPLDGPKEVGSGIVREEDVPLSQLIDLVNERFGTDFNQADQLFFDQIIEAAVSDDGLLQAAAVNPEERFALVFRNLLERFFVERMDQNEEIFVRYMNDEAFRKIVSGWMSSEAYRRLRASSVNAGTAGSEPTLPAGLRLVDGRSEERYVTCIPLVPLKAAAGAFGDPQHIEDDGFEWVAVESRHRLRPGMFVAQVVGESMEPAIAASAWCLFRTPVEGTRQGRTVLVQLRDATDPETGQRYTVKRYRSEKTADADAWRHEKIVLEPLNPDFAPIILTGTDAGELQVIAEFVEVLGEKS